jgi:predicted secreted protein
MEHLESQLKNIEAAKQHVEISKKIVLDVKEDRIKQIRALTEQLNDKLNDHVEVHQSIVNTYNEVKREARKTALQTVFSAIKYLIAILTKH